MVFEQKSNIPINEDGYISLKVDDILIAEMNTLVGEIVMECG